MVTFDVEITLDTTIGSPVHTRIDIDMVPTPGNLSTTINSAQLRGTGSMYGLDVSGPFTTTGTAHATLESFSSTSVRWVATSGLGPLTDLIVLRGQMALILN